MLKDNARGYGLITIIVHWVSVLAIVFLFGLGLYMTSLSYYEPWYHKGPSLHVSIGLLLAILTLARLLWRLFSRSPDPLPNHSLLIRFAATSAKVVLYALIFTVLATGYLITTAEGKGPDIFGWVTFPVLVELGADNVDLAGEIHLIFAWAIIVVAALHGLAALVHHFVIRDKTLVRMLKPVKTSTDSHQGD
ncbi:cytochrome b [Gilvimarinus algae]|uniref:Cytochrome b n=1 Tax=Gilvimarinus algae TaxID=3058037 RepID=A0ABT8TBG3_9GAMM|nr:cytochrome b [Gilvimarinus sp. SDUM040014]MDO3381449.1 cytochrome b [Gilvimarinus sp. SDUM040014]